MYYSFFFVLLTFCNYVLKFNPFWTVAVPGFGIIWLTATSVIMSLCIVFTQNFFSFLLFIIFLKIIWINAHVPMGLASGVFLILTSNRLERINVFKGIKQAQL